MEIVSQAQIKTGKYQGRIRELNSLIRASWTIRSDTQSRQAIDSRDVKFKWRRSLRSLKQRPRLDTKRSTGAAPFKQLYRTRPSTLSLPAHLLSGASDTALAFFLDFEHQ